MRLQVECIVSYPKLHNKMPEHRKSKKDNARRNYELNGKYSARYVRIYNEQIEQMKQNRLQTQNNELSNPDDDSKHVSKKHKN